VSLSFDKSAWFAFDKPAHVPCPKLAAASTCTSHATLESDGQAGCAAYDCYGAGQRTCRLFGGSSWRDSAGRATAMFATFRRLEQLHELRWLLHEAGRLALRPEHARERARLLLELEPREDFSLDSLAALDLEALARRARRWLRGLHVYFPEQPRRRLPVLR
jgi:hypothetical protein